MPRRFGASDEQHLRDLATWAQSELNLSAGIEAAIEFYAATARPVRAAMTLEAPQGMLVRAVPKPLDRILRSLVDNAQRFSPPDASIVIAVSVTERNMVRISVTDHGPGIPAEHIPRLFQPLHQVDATDRRSHSGFGVSLAICHRLATAMGGRLGYEPVAGGGSRFFLDLPS